MDGRPGSYGSPEDEAMVSKARLDLVHRVDLCRTVLTTYVPAMYIPDPDSRQSLEADIAPIRQLSIGADSATARTAKWESPNYFTGLAGALGAIVSDSALCRSSPLTRP